jgi:hypothetical protein
MSTKYASVLSWAVSTIAKAFDTTSLDIVNDRYLQTLRDGLTCNQVGHGVRDGVYIFFYPSLQVIRFECGIVSRAIEIAESTGGARRGSFVSLLVPQHIIDSRWSEAGPPS